MHETLTIEQHFPAPPQRVWEAWTIPELLEQWSSPHDFVVTEASGELRVGGEWHSTMREKHGDFSLQLGGVYEELEAPTRIVCTHYWLQEDGTKGEETRMAVTITEDEQGTVMRFEQTGFNSPESMEGHAGGWAQCFERLNTLLK